MVAKGQQRHPWGGLRTESIVSSAPLLSLLADAEGITFRFRFGLDRFAKPLHIPREAIQKIREYHRPFWQAFSFVFTDGGHTREWTFYAWTLQETRDALSAGGYVVVSE